MGYIWESEGGRGLGMWSGAMYVMLHCHRHNVLKGSDESHCNVSLTPSLPLPVKISGLKDGRTRLQTVYFQSYNTSTFNAISFLMKILSRAGAKKKTKRLKSFKYFALLLVVSE